MFLMTAAGLRSFFSEVLVDSKKQNWFKRAHVGKFLELVHFHRSTARLAGEDQKTRAFLQAEVGGGVTL